MFWSRAGREVRRQKVLDELLQLDPTERQAYVAVAVAAGDVRASEVDETLRLVHRLDSLRVMTLSPSRKSAPAEDLPTARLELPASTAARISKVRKPRTKRSAGSVATRHRTGSYSSRQRRPRALVAISIVPADTASRPDEALDHNGLEPPREPSWPDISWLRPETI